MAELKKYFKVSLILNELMKFFYNKHYYFKVGVVPSSHNGATYNICYWSHVSSIG